MKCVQVLSKFSIMYGCTGFDFLKSDRSRIWPDLGTQIRPELEPDSAETCFWENNTPVIKLVVLTMLSAAVEAVQFCASFVVLLFASLW